MTGINDNHTTKKTHEAHEAYIANRKEAGRVIDMETCEIGCWHTYYFDPYRICPDNDDPPDSDLMEQWGRYHIAKCWFVRSEESGGWIVEDDLPPEKQQAMYDRIARERRLLRAARAAHPMLKAVSWEWIGDDEAPSSDAMIKWFKVSYPAQAREVEGRAQDQGGDRRIVLWPNDDDGEMPF